MIDLVFDTETTGFALFKESHTNERQPHLVQLAARLVEGDELHGAFQCVVNGTVKCDEGATKTHGITEEKRRRVGVEPIEAVGMFVSFVGRADRIVAHNIAFDMLIMKAAYYRAGLHDLMKVLEAKPYICTMRELTPIMKIPSARGGYKWPKLIEAYKELVDPAGFSGAHDAMVDVIACEKVLRAWERL